MEKFIRKWLGMKPRGEKPTITVGDVVVKDTSDGRILEVKTDNTNEST